MTRKISRLGLLLSMASVLGDGVPYPEDDRLPADPEPDLYLYGALPSGEERAAMRRRAARAATAPQRERDAEAKRARRRERNLRNAAKAAPPAAVLKSEGAYYIGVDFASTRPKSIDWEEVEPPAPLPWPEIESAPLPAALTPNQQVLLTHLEGGYDRPVSEILPYFPTPQSARATIAAAVKVGLVEVLGVWIRITPFGVVSLAAAR